MGVNADVGPFHTVPFRRTRPRCLRRQAPRRGNDSGVVSTRRGTARDRPTGCPFASGRWSDRLHRAADVPSCGVDPFQGRCAAAGATNATGPWTGSPSRRISHAAPACAVPLLSAAIPRPQEDSRCTRTRPPPAPRGTAFRTFNVHPPRYVSAGFARFATIRHKIGRSAPNTGPGSGRPQAQTWGFIQTAQPPFNPPFPGGSPRRGAGQRGSWACGAGAAPLMPRCW